LPGFVDRGVGIGAMHLVEVDPVGLQPCQAVFDSGGEMTPRVTTPVSILRRYREMTLGGEDHLVAAPLEGLPDDCFALPIGVHVRGVYEVDATVQRGMHDSCAVGSVWIADRTEHHRPQAQGADMHSGLAKRAASRVLLPPNGRT
jgi:hypothetical protein